MSDTITVIYEKGVLRPILPLPLPENTLFQVRIVPSRSRKQRSSTERQHVYEALLDAGLTVVSAPVDSGKTVSDQALAKAAKALGMAGSISELIISERDEF